MAIWYVIGILACVFHLANGIWSMGITWGVWVSQPAQHRALVACTALGIALAAVGLGALGGMRDYGQGKDFERAQEVEQRMYDQKVESGEISPDSHKRTSP